MNNSLKEIFVGMLLGDGHIRRSGLKKAYITFEQSAKKTDYFNYVREILNKEGFNISDTKIYTREDQRYSTSTSSVHFSTYSLEELQPLAEIFLDESGKKKIPSNIGEHLTMKSLAHWIMDDGQQVKKGGVTLCTDSYNSEEIGFLRKALETNFNLITSIHKKKNSLNPDSPYDRIYINKSSLDNIKENLKEHMHSSMYYKLNIDPIEQTKINENDNIDPKINTLNKSNTESVSDLSDISSDID